MCRAIWYVTWVLLTDMIFRQPVATRVTGTGRNSPRGFPRGIMWTPIGRRTSPVHKFPKAGSLIWLIHVGKHHRRTKDIRQHSHIHILCVYHIPALPYPLPYPIPIDVHRKFQNCTSISKTNRSFHKTSTPHPQPQHQSHTQQPTSPETLTITMTIIIVSTLITYHDAAFLFFFFSSSSVASYFPCSDQPAHRMCTQTSFTDDEILPSLREQNSANGRLTEGLPQRRWRSWRWQRAGQEERHFLRAGGRSVGKGEEKTIEEERKKGLGHALPWPTYLPSHSLPTYLPVHLPTYLPIEGTVTDRTVGSWNCSWSTYRLNTVTIYLPTLYGRWGHLLAYASQFHLVSGILNFLESYWGICFDSNVQTHKTKLGMGNSDRGDFRA